MEMGRQRMSARTGMMALGFALWLGNSCVAADLDVRGAYAPETSTRLRFFPRSDGVDRPPVYALRTRAVPVGCTPRRAPVPTNAPDDPSYVGSEYGLSHPSYYGFTPPLGVDDPYGRSLLPYCP